MILNELRSFIEIADERRRQDERWGGPAHDDQYSTGDWLLIIDHYLNRAQFATRGFGPDSYRELLVQVAALSIAAVESYDRKAKADALPPVPQS